MYPHNVPGENLSKLQPRRKTHWLLNNMYNKQNEYVHMCQQKTMQTTTITTTETECKAVRT